MELRSVVIEDNIRTIESYLFFETVMRLSTTKTIHTDDSIKAHIRESMSTTIESLNVLIGFGNLSHLDVNKVAYTDTLIHKIKNELINNIINTEG